MIKSTIKSTLFCIRLIIVLGILLALCYMLIQSYQVVKGLHEMEHRLRNEAQTIKKNKNVKGK